MEASILATLGGACMGTYPIFVKAPRVLEAKVHPAIFQLYKSVWVALTGVVLIGLRFASGTQPVYAFTWWGVAAALAWVPAGSCLIAAVPRAGVGGTVLIFDGSTTLLSFLVFTMAFHEPIKSYALEDGSVYFRAPFYLAGALIGMAGLVLLPKWLAQPQPTAAGRAMPVRYSRGAVPPSGAAEPLLGAQQQQQACAGAAKLASPSALESGACDGMAASPAAAPAASDPHASASSIATGYALAVLAGALSALQYGLVTTAKKQAGVPPSAVAAEALDAIGSWTFTFGLGSVMVNAAGIGAVAGINALSGGGGRGGRGEAVGGVLSLSTARAIMLPASAAGVFYCWSMVLTTLAVQRGGNATVLAQRNAASLVVSGLWSLLYYREIRGVAALAWALSAVLTMICVVLLGLEKAA